MKEKSKLNFGLILTVYLLGIFMGALDTGIVTPARTVIQESLNVGDKAGIWMITVYTLSYAASIPVMGKLADRMGRRTIYLLSIFLFGGGSLFCGLSHGMNSFTALLIARAVQAVGGGGIMPVATAEFGTTFPEEKRGMALGMVGGVYGVANIFGASVGSAVMDFFGTGHWEFIFFVNVPIAVFILAAGFFCLPNTKEKSRDPIDGTGICVLVIMVLCIMYGLKNIDFFNFRETLQSTDVYPYLLIFLALLPIFVWIERRAADPVMNLHYFSNPRILITLGVSIITGIVLMGVIFVPQLCENAMEVPSGKGGYFVIILGVFAGVGAPFSGRLTDRFGPRAVLGAGLIASILGSLTVIFSTTVDPGWPNVIAALMFIGLGIGFTMGAPLNYMMLWETDYSEIETAMVGEHQAENLKTALAVLEVLRRERIVRIERSALYEGLRTAYQPARFEVVAGRERWTGGEKKGPAVILDGAHNEAGAKALKETVNRFFAGERILLVLGILRDKEVDAILEQMTDITGEIITTAPDSPRKLGADELADRLRSRGIEPLAVAETPEECVRAAMERKSEYDAVLFAGSLYLVGAVRRLLRDGQ